MFFFPLHIGVNLFTVVSKCGSWCYVLFLKCMSSFTPIWNNGKNYSILHLDIYALYGRWDNRLF